MVRLDRHLVEEVYGKRSLDVAGGVEVYKVSGSPAWDGIKKNVGQVAVRVDEGNAGAFVDVCRCETLKQGGFSCARLAENVGMSEEVVRFD